MTRQMTSERVAEIQRMRDLGDRGPDAESWIVIVGDVLEELVEERRRSVELRGELALAWSSAYEAQLRARPAPRVWRLWNWCSRKRSRGGRKSPSGCGS